VPDPLLIDFETRSPLDIREVGIYRYVEDPRTDVLCFAVKQGRRSDYFLGNQLHADDLPWWVLDALEDEEVELHAHNATVERLIIRRIMGPRYKWPRVAHSRWRCSAARARRLALPGALDKLGPALGLVEELQKDKEGKNLIRRLSKPIKRTPQGFEYDNDPVKLDRFGKYCLQDVIAEEAAEANTFDMPAQEQAYYELTEKINDRGVRVDVPLIRRLIWRANEATEELNDKLREITRGEVQALTQVAQLKAWVNRETGVELLTLRKEDMDGLVKEGLDKSLPGYVISALKIRQEGAKSSVSKLLAILNRVSADGRVHGAFVYHGASTGRYTSMGVQLQNLVRDTLKDYDKEIQELENFTLIQISKAIRGVFIPEEGHVYVDADYSAVEARGVAWLFDCKKLVKIFANDGDPYVEIACVIYERKVTAADADERWTGKQTILGCGYGMGPNKFAAQCEKFGKPVPMELADKSVRSYREDYPEIPQGWRDMEHAAVQAVLHPGETFEIPNGKIAFRVHRGYLQMALPSGRRLFYKDPFIRYEDKFGTGRKKPVLWFWGINPKTKQWHPEKTWGGTLTENAVQAFCRDLLFRAMLRLEDEFEIPLVLSVHDQIVGEVLEEDGPWAVRIVKRVLEDLPPWAAGFPIKAEPKITQRFGK
jgi:DNA polymerase